MPNPFAPDNTLYGGQPSPTQLPVSQPTSSDNQPTSNENIVENTGTLSLADFGQKIKDKYPQYQNIDNVQLANMVLKKYPQYQSSVNSQPTQPTLGQQAVEFGKGVVKGAARTVNDTSQGVINNPIPQNQPNPMAGGVIGKILDAPANILKWGYNKVINAMPNSPIKQALAPSQQPIVNPEDVINKQLQPSNEAQKLGGYAETAAELAVPAVLGIKAAKDASLAQKALSLGLNETDNFEPKAINALDNIVPKASELTPTEYSDSLKNGRVLPKTATQPAQIIATDEEKRLAQTYPELLQSKDPVVNINHVLDNAATVQNRVGSIIAENNHPIDTSKLQDTLLNNIVNIDDVNANEKMVDKKKLQMIDNFVNSLAKPGETPDLQSVFDNRNSATNAAKAFSGSPTLQKELAQGLRRGIQEFIGNELPESTYQDTMKQWSDMFKLSDNLDTIASKEKGKNALQVWIKNNPTIAKTIGWGLGITGTLAAGDGALKVLVPAK